MRKMIGSSCTGIGEDRYNRLGKTMEQSMRNLYDRRWAYLDFQKFGPHFKDCSISMQCCGQTGKSLFITDGRVPAK